MTDRVQETEIGLCIIGLQHAPHARIQKVFTEGVRFLVDYGREDTIITIIGASSASQRNTIKMAFRWRADVAQH